jgi:WD40 repeat protein
MALAVWGMASETPETPITMLDARTGKLLFQTSGVDFSSYPINMNGASSEATESGPVVWSSDGKRLALLVYENSTDQVKVCDARTGRLLFTCQPVEGALTSCSWSPDGRYLAAGTIDGKESYGDNSRIQFWDAQSGQALFSYQAPRAPGQLIWSPDSHLLAVYNPQDYGQMGLHIGFSRFHLQVFEVTA